MNAMTLRFDDGDTQGLARFGYRRFPEAVFLTLSVENAAAARRWLAEAPVADAVLRPAPPSRALHVALSRPGLDRLGVPPAVVAGFSAEFLSGMAGEESRSRRLGDVGESRPEAWAWGGPGRSSDLLVLLYAQAGELPAFAERVERELAHSGLRLETRLQASNLSGVEPFGFKDGLSQPDIDFARRLPPGGPDRATYSNRLALGEVLLGYPNEYGKYTDRPVLPRDTPFAGALPAAEDAADRLDLGRNGSYLVLRQLRQDVRGFWQFLDQKAGYRPEERRHLAEAMVGRTLGGDPLVPLGSTVAGVGPDAEDVRYNQFTYEGDPLGERCPLGAHARRANPRNADLPGARGPLSRLSRMLALFGGQGVREDVVASARFHRMVRRGRPYGPRLSPEEAVRPAPAGDPERGLYFLCLNANLGRQFEFVQNAWIMSTSFGGLSEEGDPLLGSRAPLLGCPATDAFSLAAVQGVRPRLAALPRFVTVRGGAYFFLPGIRALRYIAAAGGGTES